jgi:hypothetical protein
MDARHATVSNSWVGHEIVNEEQVTWGLTHLAFDKDTLIARIQRDSADTQPTTAPTVRWLVFDFQSGKESYFDSEKTAFDEARRRGFTERLVLESLQTHYNRCFP